MSLNSWLKSIRTLCETQTTRVARSKSRNRRRSDARRPAEVLESRQLLTTFTVNSTDDTSDANPGDGIAADANGNVTLRAAIEEANAFAGADTIEFNDESLPGVNFHDATPDVITLGGTELTISSGISIIGPGASLLTVSGGNQSRVIDISSSASVILDALSVSNGNTDGSGGGILNSGSAVVRNSMITLNSAGGSGGIQNRKTMTIENSTIAHNTAGTIGGIGNTDTLNVTNSTIVGNSSNLRVGGIYSNGRLNVTNATISDNTNTNGVGGLVQSGPLAASVNNTIFAGNVGGDLAGNMSGANNLVQDGDFNGLSGISGDPQLGPLQDNGGSTFTVALLPGSPAIDAGDNALAVDADGNALTSDQRGYLFARIGVSTVDIGAFESVEASSLVVTTAADVIDETDGVTSLREAILFANDPNANGGTGDADNDGQANDTITFDSSVDGTPILLTIAGDEENASATGDLDVTSEVTIVGNGIDNTIIDAGARFTVHPDFTTTIDVPGLGDRVIDVRSGGTLKLRETSLTGGSAGRGGGVHVDGTLSIVDSRIHGNNANFSGGGVEVGGTLTVIDSTFSANAGRIGAGIRVGFTGAATVHDSAFTENSASRDGGGLQSHGDELLITGSTFTENSAFLGGGGVSSTGPLTVERSTITKNTSSQVGGGVYLSDPDSTINFIDSTISENLAGTSGGGIIAAGTLNVTNSTISGNTAVSGAAGIRHIGHGEINVYGSTIVDNVGPGLDAAASSSGAVNNTIIAGNSARDFKGTSLTGANNFVQDGIFDGLSGLSGDPMLGPLADNGGPTWTHALLPGSPAINAGDNSLAVDADGNVLTTDQRGFSRIFSGTVDIGAFEFVAESTIEVSGNTISINDSNGDDTDDDWTVTFNGTGSNRTLTITDNNGFPVDAQGALDGADGDLTSSVTIPIGNEDIVINSGGGNDTVEVVGAATSNVLEVNGGPGNDTFETSGLDVVDLIVDLEDALISGIIASGSSVDVRGNVILDSDATVSFEYDLVLGDINLGSHTLTLAGQGSQDPNAVGSVSGTGSIVLDEMRLENFAQATYTGTTTIQGIGSTLFLNTDHLNGDTYTIRDSGQLSGNGSTASDVIVESGATIDPDMYDGINDGGPGTLGVGSLTMESGTTLQVDIGVDSGTVLNDQLDVSGTVTLNDATLVVVPESGLVADREHTFLLISNDDTDAVNGTFAGLPEGSLVTVAGTDFMISYVAGDGNDVALVPSRTVPEVLAELPDVNIIEDDVAFEVDASGTFQDVDGQQLTITFESDRPDIVSVTNNLDGTVTLTPQLNANGTVQITATATDPDSNSVADVFEVRIAAVNDAGIFGGDLTSTVFEDNTATGTASFSDVADGYSVLNFELATDAANGLATVNSDGSWTYTPDSGFLGVDAFTIRVTDDGGNVESQEISVAVAETPSLVVTTAADVIDETDGVTSLREAVLFANDPNANGGTGDADNDGQANDTITFDSSLNGTPILLTIAGDEEDASATGDLDITSEVTIIGNGAENTIIDAGTRFTVNANLTTTIDVPGLSDRVLHVESGQLTLRSSTVTGGHSEHIGEFGFEGVGGGILAWGTLHMEDSVVRDNHADRSAGGVRLTNGTITRSAISGNSAGTHGGGVEVQETVVILHSTISGNSARHGGGISNGGSVTVANSTVSGNSAESLGGGIFNVGSATVGNSTISGNSADTRGGGILNATFGTARVNNTIIAGSTSGGDLDTLRLGFTGSNNLVQDGNFEGLSGISGDPMLGPLQDNGGPTFTHALLAGSSAINAGDDALAVDADGNALTTDQRGENRFIGTVDIGAFEVQNLPPVADAGEPYSVDEGSDVILDASASTDPNDSIADYEWDFNYDGTTFDVDATGATPDFAGIDDGTTTVALRVRDSFGAESGVVTTTVEVSNLDPAISGLTTNAASLESKSDDGVVTLSGSVTDAGTLDTHEVVVDWGDGTVETIVAAGDLVSSPDLAGTQHSYAAGGIYTVTVTVTDDDGGTVTETTSAVVQGVGLVDGVLYIIGTNGDDKVTFKERHQGTQLKVRAKFDGGPTQNSYFDIADIDRIEMHLCDGDDYASLTHGHWWHQHSVDIPATINGGDGEDVLIGGSSDDVLNGGDGEDLIYGNGGDDQIDGGSGDDCLHGDSGDDTINGGDGNDWIEGGWGDDIVYAGADNDRIWGGSGDDILLGQDGDDKLFGGWGDDILIGGSGADRMYGWSGDDLLITGDTNFDSDETKLKGMRDLWTGSGSHSSRQQAVLDSGLEVIHDDDIDYAWGQWGCDWLLLDGNLDHGC